MVEMNKIDDRESMVTLCAIQMEPRIGHKEENVRRRDDSPGCRSGR